MALATSSSPILVLHDVVLHHGRLPQLIRRRGGRDYLDLMSRLYGDEGRRAARTMLSAGRDIDASTFPLFEDMVTRSAGTIVHSEFARRQVLSRLPDAPVRTVPMGVPLPNLVPSGLARERLGIPASAFVVASITHVNPNKRLHVVFRALRRIKDRLPEVLLIVAGSVSPSIDLHRLARVYGVERHVRLLGYVSDVEARLLARASDVCVNLRYPSAGETSASLLRLLGAGRPVIVTDDESTAEYPRSAVLPVPVDRFEDEMVAEFLLLLANDGELRDEVGTAARAFIEERHTMPAMIDGYRGAVRDAFGIALPPAGVDGMHEPPPDMEVRPETTMT
ncbi:MAG: glycosyltransferase family 4 protein, partial [Chloroflexota bacterium]|nr:glycosyltransferase family 4 protein [Chloroflexota bacterium]